VLGAAGTYSELETMAKRAGRPKAKSAKDDPERIARMLIDAQHLGDRAAAKKHNVSTKTIQRYRKLAAVDSEMSTAVSTVVAAEKKANAETWRADLQAARKTLLDRVVHLASQSDNLYHVTGALKIATDAENAERVFDTLTPGGEGDGGLGQPGAGSAGAGEAVAEAPRRMLGLLAGGAGKKA
jgi:primosomal protein N'